jgi:hypothetical protein
MSLIIPENTREPWSKVTRTELLRPHDELKIIGLGFIATVGVLDSHDPSIGDTADVLRAFGLGDRLIPDHHHVLLQFEGSDEVAQIGLLVGQGEVEDMIFPHVRYNVDDDAAEQRLVQIADTVRAGTHGMYFMSGNEQLSATPQGQAFVQPDGTLLK